jgi:hypothetical protein
MTILEGQAGHDKMWQVTMLVDDIRNVCMRKWKLGKYLSIDEMMVYYKGLYFLAQ